MAIPKPVRGLPQTPQEWGDLLYNASLGSMKEKSVPMMRGLASSIKGSTPELESAKNKLFNLGGYAMRGALSNTPFGGLGTRQLIPQAGNYEPTTPEERAVQDVSQGLYGLALTAPITTGGNIAAGLSKAVTQTLPRTIGYAAGIGSTFQMGKNVLSGQVPSLKPGGATETLGGLTAGVPEAALRSVQYGVKLAPLMMGAQMGVQAIAQKVPALNALTEQSIQQIKPQPGMSTGQWWNAVGREGLARLVRATLIETPLESVVYGMANKMPKESLIASIEREVLPNLIYNIGYAGMNTADDATSSLTPMIKEQIANAIDSLGSGKIPTGELAGQAGFIGGPLMPGFAKGAQYSPLTEGPEAKPRVMVSDAEARFKMPEVMGSTTVEQVLDHPKLFEQYPEMKNVKVEFDDVTNESTTEFLGTQPTKIILGIGNRTPAETRADLLHEIQHGIQVKEGFASGTDIRPKPGASEYELWQEYMRQPGESEARAVARMADVPQNKLGTFDPYAGDQYATRARNIPPSMSDLAAESTAITKQNMELMDQMDTLPKGSQRWNELSDAFNQNVEKLGALQNQVPTATGRSTGVSDTGIAMAQRPETAGGESNRNWAIQTLFNDENSSDQELIKYFTEGGLSKEQAQGLIRLRSNILTNPFAGMDGSKERISAEQIIGLPQSQSATPGYTAEEAAQAMKQMKNIPAKAPYHVTVYSGVSHPMGGRWVMDEQFFANEAEAKAFADASQSMGPGGKANKVEITQDAKAHSFPGRDALEKFQTPPEAPKVRQGKDVYGPAGMESSPISKDEFKRYVAVQNSGVTNMFDINTVQSLSGLDKDKILTIMKDYGALEDQYLTTPKGVAKNIPQAPAYDETVVTNEAVKLQNRIAELDKAIADPNTNQQNLNYIKQSRDILDQDLKKLYATRNKNWNPLQDATLVYDENNRAHYINADTGEELNPRIEPMEANVGDPNPIYESRVQYNKAVRKYNAALENYVGGGGMKAGIYAKAPTVEIRKLLGDVDQAKALVDAVDSGNIGAIKELNKSLPRKYRLRDAVIEQMSQYSDPKYVKDLEYQLEQAKKYQTKIPGQTIAKNIPAPVTDTVAGYKARLSSISDSLSSGAMLRQSVDEIEQNMGRMSPAEVRTQINSLANDTAFTKNEDDSDMLREFANMITMDSWAARTANRMAKNIPASPEFPRFEQDIHNPNRLVRVPNDPTELVNEVATLKAQRQYLVDNGQTGDPEFNALNSRLNTLLRTQVTDAAIPGAGSVAKNIPKPPTKPDIENVGEFTDDFNGSSLKGKINTTYDDLVATFGEPSGPSKDGKVKAEWYVKINGIPVTIYDWKSDIDPKTNTDWHIGGTSKVAEGIVNSAMQAGTDIKSIFDITPGKRKDALGTSYQGRMKADYEQLVQKFGLPTSGESGDGKTKAEWNLKVNGEPITIYDYKSDVSPEENTDWHIGGNQKAKAMIPRLFRDFNLENAGIAKNIPAPKPMTRQEYIDQFGEDPVDMFGKDWKKVVNANTAPSEGTKGKIPTEVNTFSKTTEWTPETTRKALLTIEAAMDEIDGGASGPRAKLLRAVVTDAWDSLLNNKQIGPYEQKNMFNEGRYEGIEKAVSKHYQETPAQRTAKNIPGPKDSQKLFNDYYKVTQQLDTTYPGDKNYDSLIKQETKALNKLQGMGYTIDDIQNELTSRGLASMAGLENIPNLPGNKGRIPVPKR